LRLADLERLLRPLRRRLAGLLARGVWRLTDQDAGLRVGQVTRQAGEVHRAEHVEPYGFTARPLPGAEAFIAAVGGNLDHPLIIAVCDRRYRLKGLAEGEVALYDDQGTRLVLRRGGVVEIVASGGVRITGDLEASGDVADGVGSLAEFRALFNAHTHVEHGEGGGVTDPPLPQAP